MQIGGLARLAAEVAEHKRDPYAVIEELAGVGKGSEKQVPHPRFARYFGMTKPQKRVPRRVFDSVRNDKVLAMDFSEIDHLGIAGEVAGVSKGDLRNAGAEPVGRRNRRAQKKCGW